MMEKKNTTVNNNSSVLYETKDNKRVNIMGSAVVDGFACKPVKLDPTKPIYAECAGLLYLSKAVDSYKMSSVLDVT